MSFIDNHRRVSAQRGIGHELPQQHTISHVLDDGVFGGVVFEPDGVADFLPDFDVHFLGDSGGNGHGGDSSGLGASNFFVVLSVAEFVKVLGELGGFSGTGFADHDDNLVVVDELHEFLAVLENGQGLLDKLHGVLFGLFFCGKFLFF